MSKHISISETTQFSDVEKKHKWIKSLSSESYDTLRNNFQDVWENGHSLSEQGASFHTKRSIDIDDVTVVLSGNFGRKSLIFRVLQKLGFV